MPNPNNCSTCKYKQCPGPDDPPEQWCYMFRDEPTDVCMQHTGRQILSQPKAPFIDPMDLPIYQCNIDALKGLQGDYERLVEAARKAKPTLVKCYAIMGYRPIAVMVDSFSAGSDLRNHGRRQYLLDLYKQDPIVVTDLWIVDWAVAPGMVLVKWPTGNITVLSPIAGLATPREIPVKLPTENPINELPAMVFSNKGRAGRQYTQNNPYRKTV